MSTDENENTPDENVGADTAGDQLDEVFTAGDVHASDELQTLRDENAELKDRMLRTHAELENFRRRTQKESLDAMKYQSVSVIRELLPGLDNLKRAIDAAEQSGDTQNLVDGIKMVAVQFENTLKNQHCEQISPEGEAFDPNLHEALTQVPSADHEPMTVLQVIEPGYRIHDRIIRPAKVIVSSAVAPPADESASNTEG